MDKIHATQTKIFRIFFFLTNEQKLTLALEWASFGVLSPFLLFISGLTLITVNTSSMMSALACKQSCRTLWI